MDIERLEQQLAEARARYERACDAYRKSKGWKLKEFFAAMATLREAQRDLAKAKGHDFDGDPAASAASGRFRGQADKCQRRGRLGRTNPAPRLRRTAKANRTTTSKRPGLFASDTTWQ